MRDDIQQIWQAFRARPDQANFEPVYMRTRALVWTLCCRILNNEEDARDAFQAAYTRLLGEMRQQPISKDAESPPCQILYRLAVHEANNLRMRRARRAKREVAMDPLPTQPVSTPAADDLAAQKEVRDRLVLLMEELPDENRVPLQLHYFDGLTQTEIADVLEINQATISRRLSKGIRELEPLARRAGLEDILRALGVVTLGAALMQPPAAFSAAAIFTHAQAALVAGTAGVHAATLGTKSATALQHTFWSALKIKTSTALVSVALVGGFATFLTLGAIRSGKTTSTAPQAVQASASVALDQALSKPAAKPNQELTVAAAQATPAPAASATAVPQATPVPLPDGPTLTLAVAVQHDGSQLPVGNVAVTLKHSPDENNEYQATGKTDQNGQIELKFPQAWKRIKIATHDPKLLDEEKIIELPQESPVVMTVKPGGKLFGTVRLAGENSPVGDAKITISHAGDPRGNRTIQSNADGSFKATAMPPGQITITAASGKLRSDLEGSGAASAAIPAGGAFGPMNLILGPGATVRGQVMNSETGAPIAGANVNVIDGCSGLPVEAHPKAVTDQQGEYKLEGLPKNQVELAATVDNFARRPAILNVTQTGDTQLEFKLDPAVPIHVRVVDTEGKPIEDAVIEAIGLKEGFSTDEGKTNASGELVMPNISRLKLPGLSAKKKGYLRDKKTPSGPITVNPEKTRGDVTITLKSVGDMHRVVIGLVSDKEGKPIPKVNVQWSPYMGVQEGRDKTVTDESGNYRLEFEHEENVCHLSVFGDGWAPTVRKKIKPGTSQQPATQDFTLETGHTLEGDVVDEQDKPVEGARIQIMPNAELIHSWSFPGVKREATADAAGHFLLKDLSGPTVGIYLAGPRGGDWSTSMDNKTIQVDQKVRLMLKKAGVIPGRVVDGESGQPVSVFNIKLTGGGGYSVDRVFPGESFTVPDGKFVLKSLNRDNKFDFLVEAADYIPVTVKKIEALPADKAPEQIVKLSKGKKLAGALVDAASGLPITGVKIGYGVWDGSMFHWGSFNGRRNFENAQEVTSDGSGFFEVKEGNPGTLFIHVPGYQRIVLKPEDHEKYIGPDGSLRIPLNKSDVVQGVSYEKGQPVKNGALGVFKIDAADNSRLMEGMGEIKTDEAGRFSVNDLAPGTYGMYTMWRNSEESQTATQVIKQFELKAGEQKNVTFGDDLGSLTFKGRLLENQGKRVSLQLKPLFDWDYKSFKAYISKEDGSQFIFPNLKPGKYALEAVTSSYPDPDKTTPLAPVEISADLERDIQAPAN